MPQNKTNLAVGILLLSLFAFALLLLVGSVWMFMEMGHKPLEQSEHPDIIQRREDERRQAREERTAAAERAAEERRQRALAAIPTATTPWTSTLRETRPARPVESTLPWHRDTLAQTAAHDARLPWHADSQRPATITSARFPWPSLPETITVPTIPATAALPFDDYSQRGAAAAVTPAATQPWAPTLAAARAAPAAATPWTRTPSAPVPAADLTPSQLPWTTRALVSTPVPDANLPWGPASDRIPTRAPVSALPWRDPLALPATLRVANVPWTDPDAPAPRPLVRKKGK